MIDENIKLMEEDKHHLLPDFYSKPILDMNFLKVYHKISKHKLKSKTILSRSF